MDRERNETYERIPWEMLESKGQDRQWVLFVVAGAVVLGALAYSFMKNQPVPAAPIVSPSTAPQPDIGAVVPPVVQSPGTTPADALVISEADLYAVDPERLLDEAVSRAEWFVAEYFTVDGSEASKEVLTGLLPLDVPVSKPEPGQRVFVEWVRATSVEEIEPFHYRITVLVRYLTAAGDEPYVRQVPVRAIVDVAADENGPRILIPPQILPIEPSLPEPIELGVVPEQVSAAVAEQSGATEVLGGMQSSDGGWLVVVMAPGPDGVSRLQTIAVP